MAHRPHSAREAVLCGQRGLFARLISSWKGLLSIFWQMKRSKPKPSFVWYSRNQFGFAAKTFFGGSSPSFWEIPVMLTEISTNLRRRPFFFGLHLLFGTDSRNTGQSEHRFCTTNLQLFGVYSWQKCM